MTITSIERVERMLYAMLRSQKLVAWVGGYAHGRTAANDDPFIVLYPPQDFLQHPVCRVYEQDWPKLPDFVKTAVPATAPDSPKDKDVEIRRGNYFTCPLFCVVLYEGKDTQMGPEKRFSNVIYITNRQPEQQPPQQPDRPSPAPAANGAQEKRAPLFGDLVVRGVEYNKGDAVLVTGKKSQVSAVLKEINSDNDLVLVDVAGQLHWVSLERLAGKVEETAV